MYYHNRSVTKR